MKVKEFIQHLKQFPQEANVIVSCDEELNTLFNEFQVAILGEAGDESNIVIYGLSGSEIEEDY